MLLKIVEFLAATHLNHESRGGSSSTKWSLDERKELLCKSTWGDAGTAGRAGTSYESDDSL